MALKPAAREVDATAHGGVIVSGCPTVIVNGRAAAQLSSAHVCPLHGAGPVRFGGEAALTVLIGQRPAATLEGLAECAGAAVDPIAEGSGNVYFQSTSSLAGLPVTEDADGTLHIGAQITIKGPIGWSEVVLGDFVKIASTKAGQRLLHRLDASGKPVTVAPYPSIHVNADCAALDGESARNGKGTGSIVHYNPRHFPPTSSAPPTTTGATGDVVLFHELGHAEHNAYGTKDMTPRYAKDPAGNPRKNAKGELIPDEYDNQEEFNTVEPAENDYRKERGFPPRHNHRHI